MTQLIEREMLSTFGSFEKPHPRIIFACKSNTCRSQMAEAWAKIWLSKHIDEDRLTYASLFEEKQHGRFDQRNISKEDFQTYAMALVASAALGTSSVFESENEEKCESCEGGICFVKPAPQEGRQQKKQRKAVKSKAIQVMKELGVDMGNCLPKTFPELMMLSPSSPRAKAEKIIIMCDCNISREEAYRYGESFEEWNIDAPTAAEKAGETYAYKRISLEIKKDVDRLMEQTFLRDAVKKEIM